MRAISGRDDECRVVSAAASERGELVAEALAGSGGHDEQDVAARGCGLADLVLVGAEVAVTEDAVEEFREGFGDAGAESGHERYGYRCILRGANADGNREEHVGCRGYPLPRHFLRKIFITFDLGLDFWCKVLIPLG